MKHLFYVNSHTTYLTAIGTVEYLKLKENTVIFIYARNYQNDIYPVPYQSFELNQLYDTSMKLNFKFRQLNELISMIDQIISEKVNGEYIAYLPHLGVYLMQVIASHPLCKGVNYIEEGISVYSSNLLSMRFDLKSTIKRQISYLLSKNNRYWYSNFVYHHSFKKPYPTETFGISLESYKGLKEAETNHIVKWPSAHVDITLQPHSTIFIFEAAAEMGMIAIETYMEATRQMIVEAAKQHNYVKFHPAQHKDNIAQIKNIFASNRLQYEELPSNVPFEFIMLSEKDLHIAGFGSSLLLYAKNIGHKVTSFESSLMADAKYQAYKKRFNFRI